MAWHGFYDFMESSIMMITQKHALPKHATWDTEVVEWGECDLKKNQQVGGIDGIQQTFWTLITISMVTYCTFDQNVAWHLAGQGDNQVLVLFFDKKTPGTVAAKLQNCCTFSK
jgi:hypothetical protein